MPPQKLVVLGTPPARQKPVTASDWYQRRFRQVAHSIPHYFSEIQGIQSFGEAYEWAYFKFPYAFRLKKFPPRVTVEFTNHCNFACPYCPRSVMSRSVGFMNLSFFRRLVEELNQGGSSVMKIGGLGEAVLHPEFREMMKTLASTKMQVLLYTNGTLFQQIEPGEICEWNLHTIVLSIDGLDGETFEKLRRGGSYDATRNAALKFSQFKAKRKPILEIRHVIMSNETGSELRQFRVDWLSLADTVKYNYLIPLNPVASCVPHGVKCRDIRREIYVRWDGKLLLCAGQERQETPEWLGDANQAAISELWQMARIKELRAAHSHRNQELPNCCEHCSFR